MAGDELTDRLRATFLVELHEHLRELNAALLQLEQRPRDHELIRTLFRAAHTIKGSARVVNAPLIEAACHAMESVFAELRDGERSLTGPEFSLLFAVFDALEQAGETLRGPEAGGAGGAEAGVGEGDDDDRPATAALRALVPRLTTMAGAAVRRESASSVLPPERRPTRKAAPAGPDIAPAGPQPDGQAVREAAVTAVAQASPGPTPAPASSPEAKAGQDTAEEMVRVRADRLDELMSAVGELLIATGRIVDRSDGDDTAALRLDRATDDVAAVARRLRLRPFSDACEALPRAVRDIASGADKQVTLQLSGESVEADRLVVDALRDPLLHLVRNAVDHGIEPAAERQRLGKPPAGTVTVEAELAGSRLVVTVSDDGAGIDESAVRSVFASQGRTIPPGRVALTDALLRGGFSTRREASRISGRGVGVDLVRSAMERIGGTVDVVWRPGAGTTFRLECPPTPATIRALLVRLGPHLFALPTAHVEGLRRLGAEALLDVEGSRVLPTERGPVTVHSLAALLGPPLDAHPIEGAAPLVIVRSGSRRGGLVVDEALAEDEIVVRPLDIGERLVPHAAGAAVLPSGRLALVLNAASLLSAGLRLGTTIAPAFAERREQPPQRILVADDSITTRTLEQSVLEAAGYAVRTAVDGEDAWQQLERDGADLLVADIEMPRMDGFALCRRIRNSARFADLPVVLVTGLSSEEDRARGLDAGADAYIVKSSFDQAGLLDTVRQLIGRT